MVARPRMFSPQRDRLKQFSHASWNANGKPSVVGVGSLHRIKRWDRVLRVVRKVRSLGYDCRLTMAGRGPERAALEQQARELGLGGVAEVIGATADAPDL